MTAILPAPRPDVATDLRLALRLADMADAITSRHFRSRSLVIETKPDHTEVTMADRGTETAIVSALHDERPEHAVLGEEHGVSGPVDAEFRWIIDPIDGTGNYVRNVPIWATLIARQHIPTGTVDIGVVSAPALGRRWWATSGGGAFADGKAIAVSRVAEIEHAFVSWSDGHWPHTVHRAKRARWQTVVDRSYRQRGIGDFWQHVLVAEGAVDIACEPVVSLWDLAALVPIVEEAGGRFSDLDGGAGPDGGSALSSNGLLHDAVLSALAEPRREIHDH